MTLYGLGNPNPPYRMGLTMEKDVELFSSQHSTLV